MKTYVVTLKIKLTDLKENVSISDVPMIVEDAITGEFAKKLWEIATFSDAWVSNFKVKE